VSSFLVHLLIPVLIVLSVGIFRIRDAWVWSWAAWANDTDFLGWTFHKAYGWPNVHRALFHNVFLLALALGLGWRAWRRWRPAGGRSISDFAAAKPGWLLVPYFYASHLVLDIFAGGIAPFWPLSSRTFYWDFEIDVDTTQPVPRPIVESQTGTVEGVVHVSEVYLWMTAEQFAIFLLYLLALALTFAYERWRGRPAFAWLDRRPQDPGPVPAGPRAKAAATAAGRRAPRTRPARRR
jgi:LexA-binding, inner membrane-associated putative hydrolase